MYIGIDLGTTNSVISFAQVMKDGRIITSHIEIDRVMDSGTGIEGKVNHTRSRSKTLPSCVYYYEDRIIVGDCAREQNKKYPERQLPIRKHREERENGIASAVPFSLFSVDAVTFDISKAPMPL